MPGPNGIKKKYTSFNEAAIAQLRNADEAARKNLVDDSDLATIWLEGKPRSNPYRGDPGTETTTWQYPINLANLVFKDHQHMWKRTPSMFTNARSYPIIFLVFEELPDDLNHVRHVLGWLEFFAREGVPPEVARAEPVEALDELLLVADQLGIEPLVDQLEARKAELAPSAPAAGPNDQDAMSDEAD